MSEDVFEPSSGSQADDEPGSSPGNPGSNSPKAEGRTLENVHGELTRKHDRLQKQIEEMNANMLKMVEMLKTGPRPGVQPPPRVPQPQVPGPPLQDLSQYSDEQLQQAIDSGRLDPGHRRYLERTLTERAAERKAKEMFEARDKQELYTTARAQSREAALAAFPALNDPESDFSKAVGAALKLQREQFGDFPMDEFDVANRIARQMGVEASRVTTPGFIGRTDSRDDDLPPPGPQGLPQEEIDRIAQNLRYALPIRKNKEGKNERVKFNLKRIKERSKRYEENQEFYGRKGVRG